MFQLKILFHSDADKIDLDEIIGIKSVAWPYAYEKQLKWLNENLKSTDLHLLLKLNEKTVAYLNLVDIELEINNDKAKALGVGNVCSVEKGKGFGNELMKLTNLFLLEKKKPGLLFCKSELIRFYEKFNWSVIEKKKLRLAFNNQNIETMVFNIYSTLQSFEYSGSSF